MKLQETYLIEGYQVNPYKACRIFVKDCNEFNEQCGKLLIRQFIHEVHGVDIGEVINTDQNKFEFAVKKAREYFLNVQ